MLLEANVDDATGETLAHAVAALLDAGAHDAWITPIVMKKGRPAHTVSALADPALAGQVAGVLARETGSLGVRGQTLERWPQARSTDEVEVDGRPVRVKVSAGRVKVEHDDAARVARQAGLPLREVVSLAEEAWRSTRAELPDGEPPVLSSIDGPDEPDDESAEQATLAPIGHLHDGHDPEHDHPTDRATDPIVVVADPRSRPDAGSGQSAGMGGERPALGAAARARRGGREGPPEGAVARVLELGGDPAGVDQLGVQRGQVAEGHAHVDVVGQVPAGVERAPSRSGRSSVWCTTWVVRRRSPERVMPPCSAMARSRLITRHTVIHGASHSTG